MRHKLRVIDFFCGAGGFSEGFRQQGFSIIMGIDNWLPAIETHNLNHDLNDKIKDIQEFRYIKEIHALPNTEIIVGSPPCVLFSLSNRGGKANKLMGIRLIESFLRVIAVKKHQESSILKAWFMENVPNSQKYIRSTYSFRQLNLTRWAKQNGLDPNQIALHGSINGHILNTADFGVSQKRKRFVCGEIVETGKFPDLRQFTDKKHKSIGMIKGKMPKPNKKLANQSFVDPNYPSLKFKVELITDHFYDAGLYENQWRNAQNLKLNHPYMGKMSFPENENNPSRTIMATRSMTTREAMIYKSEYRRFGDGEYRLPTIREIATLMGFPYTYQFSGMEGTKCRLIGNAICPQMSSALAKSARLSMGFRIIPNSKIKFNSPEDKLCMIQNLNAFTKKKFDNPPQRKSNARFRRHPFKDGNMTIALTNYNPLFLFDSSKVAEKWYASVFMGTGRDFIVKVLPRGRFRFIAKLIKSRNSDFGTRFIQAFDKRFKIVLGDTNKFQEAFVLDDSQSKYEPNQLINEIREFILEFEPNGDYMRIPELIPEKERIPTRQVLAMYAINRVVS